MTGNRPTAPGHRVASLTQGGDAPPAAVNGQHTSTRLVVVRHHTTVRATAAEGRPMPPTHPEHEDHPWTIEIPDHPKRTESRTYRASRKKTNELAATVTDLFFGPPRYEDHHGGGLWLKDADGWFIVRNIAGIEWSAQFCADPAKVDRLRVNARRLYAAFPEVVTELGIRELLDTPITDAKGVAQWTDSLCNASLPYPRAFHQGVLPKSGTGGVHHYPSPIAEIALFKHDDFNLWVADGDIEVAVVPVSERGSGDGRTRVLYSARSEQPGSSPLAALQAGIGVAGVEEVDTDPTILPADHPVSISAYAQQNG